MLKDCKYRLPCNWCDKFDRQCLLVEYAAKQEKEKKLKQMAKNGGIIYESSDKWQL